MKFAEHLSAHITPEWRKQYIQYEVPAAAGVWEDSEGPPSRQSDLRGRLPLLPPPRAGADFDQVLRGATAASPPRRPARAPLTFPFPPPQPAAGGVTDMKAAGREGGHCPPGLGHGGGRASRRWGVRV